MKASTVAHSEGINRQQLDNENDREVNLRKNLGRGHVLSSARAEEMHEDNPADAHNRFSCQSRGQIVEPPIPDKYKLVYIIMIIHGIGTLLPWNMFIYAKDVM